MFAQPPRTFWQLAACSRAEPSPGFTAKIVLPIPVLLRSASGVIVFITRHAASSSGNFCTGHTFSSRAFSTTWISFASLT